MSDTPDVTPVSFRKYLRGIKAGSTAFRYSRYAASFLRLLQANNYSDFAKIPPDMLSDFASMLSREGLSPSTVRVQTFAVKKYLDWVRGKGIEVTRQSTPDLPRKHFTMRPCLPQEQFTLYFRQADLDLAEPVRTAVMLLPCCGLRASEMVQLRLDQIMPYTIKLKNGKTKKTLALKPRGKGNKERIVPLMEEGVEILTGYLAGWRKKQAGPWLFPKVSKEGNKKPIGDRFLRSALQELREPLGMEFTPHTMRRTYITMLWRKEIDLRTIANIAGHASIQTTIDHYIVADGTDNMQALHNAGSALT